MQSKMHQPQKQQNTEQTSRGIFSPSVSNCATNQNERELSSVTIKPHEDHKGKLRLYNKKQYCLFCERPFSKIARHLAYVHGNESEVIKALSFPKNSKGGYN